WHEVRYDIEDLGRPRRGRIPVKEAQASGHEATRNFGGRECGESHRSLAAPEDLDHPRFEQGLLDGALSQHRPDSDSPRAASPLMAAWPSGPAPSLATSLAISSPSPRSPAAHIAATETVRTGSSIRGARRWRPTPGRSPSARAAHSRSAASESAAIRLRTA